MNHNRISQPQCTCGTTAGAAYKQQVMIAHGWPQPADPELVAFARAVGDGSDQHIVITYEWLNPARRH